jgi:hypothetical protein
VQNKDLVQNTVFMQRLGTVMLSAVHVEATAPSRRFGRLAPPGASQGLQVLFSKYLEERLFRGFGSWILPRFYFLQVFLDFRVHRSG